MTVDLYWLTHLAALMAGACFGVGIMSWVQINRMERRSESDILDRRRDIF